MPTITLSKSEFEKLVGKKLPIEQLKDRISMLGTDLEKIEGDDIVVEVFPNRPDMLSMQGFARAFSSFIGVKTGLRQYKVEKSNYVLNIDRSVSKVRPYTMCAVVKNLKFDDALIKEIIQVQEKLHVTFCRNRKKAAIGIYPLEKIKFPITYKALAPEKIKFRPLEAEKEMTALEILQKHPTGREFAHLLEGKELFPVFEDAAGKILSMPPLINSHETGKVTESTKDVFIECSGFDIKVLSKLLNIIVTSLADMGGQVYEMILNYPEKKVLSPKLSPEEKELDLKFINKLLGLELNQKQAKELLEKMGYGMKDNKVLVPCYRADIMHQIDFAEDIAIAYGFENFIPEIPNISTVGKESEFEIFKRKIVELLLGLGLIEVNSYHLTSKALQCERMCSKIDVIPLSNSLNKDYDVLRAWLIPSHLEILEKNKSNEYPQNIFEINTVFAKNGKTETGIEEKSKLVVTLCSSDANYTKIRQILDYIFDCFRLKFDVKEKEHDSFIPGRVASVLFKNEEIAMIGEIHPKVLENFSLFYPVAAFELDMNRFFELLKK